MSFFLDYIYMWAPLFNILLNESCKEREVAMDFLSEGGWSVLHVLGTGLFIKSFWSSKMGASGCIMSCDWYARILRNIFHSFHIYWISLFLQLLWKCSWRVCRCCGGCSPSDLTHLTASWHHSLNLHEVFSSSLWNSPLDPSCCQRQGGNPAFPGQAAEFANQHARERAFYFVMKCHRLDSPGNTPLLCSWLSILAMNS